MQNLCAFHNNPWYQHHHHYYSYHQPTTTIIIIIVIVVIMMTTMIIIRYRRCCSFFLSRDLVVVVVDVVEELIIGRVVIAAQTTDSFSLSWCWLLRWRRWRWRLLFRPKRIPMRMMQQHHTIQEEQWCSFRTDKNRSDFCRYTTTSGSRRKTMTRITRTTRTSTKRIRNQTVIAANIGVKVAPVC